MRIAVYGAGAVGGQLAGRLMHAGIPVSMIARGANLAAIREHGLALLVGAEQWIGHPACSDDPRDLGVQDVVLVAVKSPALPSVAAQIAPLLGAATQVVFAMNGVPWWFLDGLPVAAPEELRSSLDPGDALRRTIGVGRMVGCSVLSGSELIAPGTVRSDTPLRNAIVLGKPDGSTPDVLSDFAALAERAGFRTTLSANIRGDMWPKLITHACRPAICGLTSMTTRQLADTQELLPLVGRILEELIALGTRLGLSFAFDLAAELAKRPEGDHLSSFVQDLEAGRAPELASGIGAMCRIARAAGVDTPMLDVVCALITARIASRRATVTTAHATHGAP